MNTKNNMAFYHLFVANLKMLYRNWRGLFWNIFIPLFLYTVLSLLPLKNLGVKGLDYSAYLLPGMIAMTVMQTGVFSLAYWLIDLKQRGVMKRFMITPMSKFDLVGSLVATRLLIMLVQITLLSLIGILFFDVQINGSWPAIFIITFMGGTIFLSVGFIISLIANTYDEAAPITAVNNLIMTFLGNIFFPTEVFPKILQLISHKLPITYMSEGLRNNFINQAQFMDSWKNMLALLVWLIIVFSIAVYTFRIKQE